MSTTSTSPAYSLPGRTHRPDLRPVERRGRDAVHRRPLHLAGRRVHARTGRRRRSRAPSPPPSPRSPDPRAPAATPEQPVPSSASTITCALLSRPASNGTGAAPGQLLELRLRVLAHPLGRPHGRTSTSRPAWRSSRAATIPSPPLLPLPQTIAIRPAGARRATTPASPSPARSISSSTATFFSLIAQRSSSRISPASSSGSIQRGRLIAAESYPPRRRLRRRLRRAVSRSSPTGRSGCAAATPRAPLPRAS